MRIFLLAAFAFLSFQSFSQTTLKFCVLVDSLGDCMGTTSEFDVMQDGGTVSFLLKNDKGLGMEKVRYRIYYVDTYGNEKLHHTFDQKTGKNWNYAWQDVVFYDAGTYKVKVYNADASDAFVCSEILKIFKP